MQPFDHTGQFRGIHDSAESSQRTVRNAGITVFAQSCVFLIQLLGAIVLARLLTPGDFGIVTMVTTFSLLLASFGLTGFTDAIIQTPSIDHALASNLFWINLGGGFCVASAFAAIGQLLARFYGDPRITKVAIGFSVAIFFSVLPVVHLSLVKRALRFTAASGNDIFGRIAYVLTAICFACLHWGYWSLVAGAIVQPVAMCVGAWLLCQWRPGAPCRVANTGKMVRYAMNVYGRFSLNYGTGNMDNLLVGWRFGASALGFYKRAFDLFVIPSCQLLSPVLAVVVTAMSRKNNDKQEFKRYFLKAVCLVAFVAMAASADLTLIGRDLVRLLLGTAWGESGRIFLYFAPGIGLMLVYQTTAWIHLSLGTTSRWLRWTVLEFAVTGLLFLAGLRWGPSGIAGAWTTSFAVLMMPGFWYAGRPIGLTFGQVLEAIWRYAGAALIAGFACYQVVGRVTWSPITNPYGLLGAIARIVANTTIFSLFYLVAISALFLSFEPLRQFSRLVPDLLPGASRLRRARPVAESKQDISAPTTEEALPEATFESK